MLRDGKVYDRARVDKTLIYTNFCLTDQKHYVSRRVWPWPRYPSYLMGGCYAISGQAVKPLLAATQTTPFFWIEDIYLTGLCATKANVSLHTQPKSDTIKYSLVFTYTIRSFLFFMQVLSSRYPGERSTKFLLCAEDCCLADAVFQTPGNFPQGY